MDVAGALIAHEAAFPEMFHQLAPAEHPVRVRSHEGEQRELGASEATWLTVDSHSVRVGVELEPSHPEAVARRPFDRARDGEAEPGPG